MASVVARAGSDLRAPHIDREGRLWAVSGAQLVRLAENDDGSLVFTPETATPPTVQPAAVATASSAVYICDLAYKGLAVVHGAKAEEFVREYEQRALKGPCAVAVDARDNVYFCDGGGLGETGLHNPTGSVFVVSTEGQLLLPIALECLAQPTALALAPVADDAAASVIYVAEMAANRILRFVRRPEDVFVGGVFAHFSGGAGPSALACDAKGHLFVGHYDFKDTAPGEGTISRLAPDGKLVATYHVPDPEVTGLAVKGSTLYVTAGQCLYAIDM